MKHVWLNLNTGQFSDSWDDQTHKAVDGHVRNLASLNNWKLITYECENDPNFELYSMMKIVSNPKP